MNDCGQLGIRSAGADGRDTTTTAGVLELDGAAKVAGIAGGSNHTVLFTKSRGAEQLRYAEGATQASHGSRVVEAGELQDSRPAVR
jgi:hypothetical protein